MDKKYLKILAIVYTLNCIYIWIMIILGTIQLFGNGLLANLIAIPVLILNVYVHVTTYIAIEEENKKQS